MQLKILFLEDDKLYKETITDVLEIAGFEVDGCEAGKAFLEKIYNNVYDLYIIDINVPKLSGFEVMKILREYKDNTIKLVLTSIPNSVIESFKNGCDEYIYKNTDIDELILRIKTLIKRAYGSHNDQIEMLEGIIFDIFSKSLFQNNSKIHLEMQSILLFDTLIKNKGKFVSKNELEKSIYSCNSDSKSNVIRYHIWNIRKIFKGDIIISDRNLGYAINTSMIK